MESFMFETVGGTIPVLLMKAGGDVPHLGK